MARKGQSAAFLKSLRKKHHLGEFSSTKAKPKLKRAPKKKTGIKKRRKTVALGQGQVLSEFRLDQAVGRQR